MTPEEFNEVWQFRNESPFRDPVRQFQLEKDSRDLPKGQWLWAGIPIAAGIGTFLGWSDLAIFEACAAIALFEVVDLLVRILRQNHEIKVDLETVNEAVREARWQTLNCHSLSMNARSRDDLGHPL